MKSPKTGVINSNISNFCSPDKFAQAHIGRINPDKFTFLNSNLIVSNILNHLSPHHDPQTPSTDAYTACREQMVKKKDEDSQNKHKIARVHNLAKCRSQTMLEELQNRQNEIKHQVDQINIMRIEMNDKARDIMGRKEDTAYLGRNIFLQGEKFLKQMKGNTPADKANKSEATRMLMKERAKSKGRNNMLKERLNLEDASDVSNMSMNRGGPKSLNTSMSMTSLQVSTDNIDKRNNSIAKEKARDQHIATLIRNGSFESVLATQKRAAAWEAFTDNWAQGFKKNQDLIITKKKRRVRKSPKQKFINLEDNSQLDYNDRMSRHLALKKYKQTFDKTAASFQLMIN